MTAYTLTADPSCILRSDGAYIPADPDNADYADYLKWLTVGNTADPVPAPTAAELQVSLTADVQKILDAKAQSYGYDGIATAVTYADEPSVSKFQAEGQVFRAWRSAVWAAAYAYLDEVKAGTKTYPTSDELPGLLPTFTAPA